MQEKRNLTSILILMFVMYTAIALASEGNREVTYTISGFVYDGENREPLTGATLVIQESNLFAISGLDGSYRISNVPEGDYKIEIAFISYETIVADLIVDTDLKIDFDLQTVSFSLGTVEVVAMQVVNTEASARSAERNALNTINAISASAIELSPDQTVANVVQRVSGLTVERGSGGEAQYAIVRGMDKRYNYTLVNGIKIPSPDNENRYVPLDIFPAELLDQLVVSKSLTPSMEGDAIGGVVDMKMRSAHSRGIVSANISVGINEMFFQRDFDYFDPASVNRTAPMQRLNEGDRVAANMDYYSTENFNYTQNRPLPNYSASLVLGDRFFNQRLGIIFAGTYQSSNRGTDRTQFRISETRGARNLPYITAHQERRYSLNQERVGLHNKIDYRFRSGHSISLYNVWLHLQRNQTRVLWEDGLRSINEPTLENNFRSQINVQRIYNTTLQGDHKLSPKIHADWSLVYSIANQYVPDNSQLITVSNYDTPDRELRWLLHENQIRIWEDNFDRDYAAYYNVSYSHGPKDKAFSIKTGGLYRLKDRENNFDLYTFKPLPGIQEYIPYETDFADITWRITGASGTPSHALNYQSYENIFAQYVEVSFPWQAFNFLGGVRAEHTDQGFSTANDLVEDGSQTYWSILPSLHLKYQLGHRSHLRGSYFKSVSRPSFLEIIPYTRPSTEDIYVSGGNPTLRPVVAHNFDLRYEMFPNPADQLLLGVFYKNINDPIELAVMTQTDANFQPHFPSNTTVITPVNFETAINYGLELDIIRYFNRFGIRGNYTFTSSEIASVKRTWTEITADNYDQLTQLQQQNLAIGDSTFLNVIQMRPLQGQSRHLGNLSLLYKDQVNGFDAQLSAVYTGERIAIVSPGLDTDWWQKSYIQMDFSAEKRIFDSFVVFAKINNILNTPYQLYIKKPHYPSSRIAPMQPSGDTETLVREEYYGRVYQFGIKYRL